MCTNQCSDIHSNQECFGSLIELCFSFESKIVRYVHVNESKNCSVHACAFESKIVEMVRSDFDSNRRLVNDNENGMFPIGSD